MIHIKVVFPILQKKSIYILLPSYMIPYSYTRHPNYQVMHSKTYLFLCTWNSLPMRWLFESQIECKGLLDLCLWHWSFSNLYFYFRAPKRFAPNKSEIKSTRRSFGQTRKVRRLFTKILSILTRTSWKTFSPLEPRPFLRLTSRIGSDSVCRM